MNVMQMHKRGLDHLMRQTDAPQQLTAMSETHAAREIDPDAEEVQYSGILNAPERLNDIESMSLAFGVEVKATFVVMKEDLSHAKAKSWATGSELLRTDDEEFFEVVSVTHDSNTVTLGLKNRDAD